MKRFAVAVAALLLISVLLGTVALAADTAPGEKNEGGKIINVWLIAGQSNACGFGEVSNYPASYENDSYLLDTGIENVLCYGKGGVRVTDDFVPVTFGLGRNSSTVGAEAGIATALAADGQMHAVIKYAYGDTQLTAVGVNTTKNVSTWTSPSYVRRHPDVKFEGDRIGELYDGLITTVAEGVTKLREAGYTPVVRGLWWMQCERDSNTRLMTKEIYAEALRDFIKDVRSDVGSAVGADLSEMPFVYGRILRNPEYAPNSDIGLAAVSAAQDAVAQDGSLKNVCMLDMRTDLCDPETNEHRPAVQQDGWHYDSLTQQMIGEAFVRSVEGMTGCRAGFGSIPDQYRDKSEYPIAVFKGGEFAAAYKYFSHPDEGSALAEAQTLLGTGAEEVRILLRDDAAALGGEYTLCGKINIDLNGYTLTSQNGPLLPVSGGTGALEITVRGGNAVLDSVMLGDTVGGSAPSGVKLTVDNVRLAAGADTASLFGTVGTAENSCTVMLVGCTVDMCDASAMGDPFAFEGSHASVRICGGELIVADGCLNRRLYSLGEGAVLRFEEGYGKYLTVKVTGEVDDFPLEQLNMYTDADISAALVNGEYVYTADGDPYRYVRIPANADEGCTVYAIHKLGSTETVNADGSVSIEGYGSIPAEFADAQEYPVALFINGTFIGAYPYFTHESSELSALSAATDRFDALGTSDRVSILLRANAEAAHGESGIGRASCKIDVDLNGYTLFHSHTSPLFLVRTVTECEGDEPFEFNVYGGKIRLGGYLFALGCEALEPYSTVKSASLKLRDVTVEAVRGAGQSSFFATFAHGVVRGYKTVSYAIDLENCVFDLRRASSVSKSVFGLNDQSEESRVAAQMKITGGKLILGVSSSTAALSEVNGLSGVKLYENGSGEYMSIEAPLSSDIKATDAIIMCGNGGCYVYTLQKEDRGRAIYTLYPEVLEDYAINVGVTAHDSSITYNVFVPASSKVLSITVGGTVYSSEECEASIVRMNSRKYYKLTSTVSAADALTDLPITVTLKHADDENAYADFAINTLEYAKKAAELELSADESDALGAITSWIRTVCEYISAPKEVTDALDGILALISDNGN